jgi:tRNA-splicing ligase RtcB
MPDCHVGFGMPIGGVLATRDIVIPNAVGVDIGCGMCASQTSLTEVDETTLRHLVSTIPAIIPLGFKHHSSDQYWKEFDHAPDIPIIQQELTSARCQLGTLGGGNHFIEIQKGDDGQIWVMIHSGSRNFGYKAAEHYHRLAREICTSHNTALPSMDLAYLDMQTRKGQEYLEVMRYCCDFALANRQAMMRKVIELLQENTGAQELQQVNIHHNYAAIEEHYGRPVLVHRKGATRASKGLTGIVPGSMGSPSYIVRGLGNPESFESCAHGAGRRMGRKEAERKLDLAEERHKMTGIVHGLQSKHNLDEAPGAYKDIDEVMQNQSDLVEILVQLKPLASVKG